MFFLFAIIPSKLSLGGKPGWPLAQSITSKASDGEPGTPPYLFFPFLLDRSSYRGTGGERWTEGGSARGPIILSLRCPSGFGGRPRRRMESRSQPSPIGGPPPPPLSWSPASRSTAPFSSSSPASRCTALSPASASTSTAPATSPSAPTAPPRPPSPPPSIRPSASPSDPKGYFSFSLLSVSSSPDRCWWYYSGNGVCS